MGFNVVVIGGANIDIVATPDKELRMYDSNIGHAAISFGGVGRNIAENLVRLGCNVRFVTVFGNDSFSRTLKAAIEDEGIDISLCRTIGGASCSKYICLNSHDGEMIAAINDMSLYDHMGEAITEEVFEAVNNADILVLDANTSEDLLKKIVARTTVPIAFDAVSISKVARCRSILDRLFIFKPNIYEAEELLRTIRMQDGAEGTDRECLEKNDENTAGVDGKSSDERADEVNGCVAEKYARELARLGVKNVMISMGADGVYYESGSTTGKVPSMVKTIVNTSGCGDAYLAGAVRGYLEGCDIEGMVRYGSAAAAVCAEYEETVTPNMGMEKVRKYLDS